MPYGHLKQYLDLVADAQKKRLQITKRQKQQIAGMYLDIAKKFGAELSKYDSSTLTYRWVNDYAKALKRESKALYRELQGVVRKGITDTAKANAEAQERFWGGIVPELSGRFRDTLSTVPQSCMEELMSGGVYKDFTGLSERLWNYKRKYDKDISYVISRGIAEQKSAYDLAKDLETYLKPNAKKPWEWRKVYPNCNKVVDHNAQRLSRTSITHAYQMSFQRATKDNPFIEKYQWHSSNGGRTCGLCRQRDGKLFDKDSVPLDHPNGMCIITAVIAKTYDEIVDELTDYANGGENKDIDKWLYPGVNTTALKTKQIMRKAAVDFPGNLTMNQRISNIGKIDTALLKSTFPNIVTPDIVVTNERVEHIKERHPEDYALFEQYGKEAVSSPDLVIQDTKHEGTVFMIRKLEETNLNVIVRVALDTDEEGRKNSVMTFYRIREKNLQKLIKKHKLLYSKE